MRAIIFYSKKKSIPEFVDYLQKELQILNISIQLIPLIIEDDKMINFNINPKEDFAISLGGDGTVLHVARLLYYNKIIPLFPVNFGSMGFITEIKKNELIHLIKKYIKGDVFFDERLMLETYVKNSNEKKKIGFALNDIVIGQTSAFKMIDLELSINNEYVCRYRADGLIVATPTGSTGYSLSSSGPILEPDLQNILITPICPHSLRVRPLVISGDKTIEINIITKKKQKLVLDGQDRYYLKSGEMVIIRSTAKKLKIAKPDKRTFYAVLKEKLNWLD